MNKVTPEQYMELLKPLSVSRVSQRKQGGTTLSYVEAWDVKAQLIRIFGFGQFDAQVVANEFRYEQEVERNGKQMWEVAYSATVKLRIHALECVYTESAVGSAMGSRAEAHDNAIKNAASDALKRAAIYLGTQFGLSLYNNGSRSDVVGMTLDAPDGLESVAVEPDDDSAAVLERTCALYSEVEVALDEATLKEIWKTCADNEWLDLELPEGRATLRQAILFRVDELRTEGV